MNQEKWVKNRFFQKLTKVIYEMRDGLGDPRPSWKCIFTCICHDIDEYVHCWKWKRWGYARVMMNLKVYWILHQSNRKWHTWMNDFEVLWIKTKILSIHFMGIHNNQHARHAVKMWCIVKQNTNIWAQKSITKANGSDVTLVTWQNVS